MDIDRRAFVAALLVGGLGVTQVGPLDRYLEAFAPLPGETWRSATAELPSAVDSPYGEATVGYDDAGVPTTEADGDDALYFATGYVHAADRLFQRISSAGGWVASWRRPSASGSSRTTSFTRRWTSSVPKGQLA